VRSDRVPALDGVRAVAVSAVLAFHGGVAWLRGGFLGVDAFFVLSGYLITTLLLAEWRRRGGLDLGGFWARRARRLLPTLVVLLIVVVAVNRIALPAQERALLRGDGLATVAYLANWRMISRGTDYFARASAPSPLQHAWSLAIEEQFYLLWPVALVVLLRWPPVRRHPLAGVLAVAVSGAAASVIAGAVLWHGMGEVNRVYFGSDTRAVSLLTGCALAAVLGATTTARIQCAGRGPRWMFHAVALAGAGVYAWALTHADGTDPLLYRGGLLLVALSTAAVLAHAVVVPRSLTARLLSLPPLPAIGRISYGLYLWHWPMFGWLNAERTGLAGARLLGVRCLATLLVAGASYLLVEQPVRGGSRPLRHRTVLAAATAALAATAVSVVALTAVGAQPPRAPTMAVPSGRVNSLTTAEPTAASTAPPLGAPMSWAPEPTSTRAIPRHHVPGTPVTVDVFGDSIAQSLVNYLPHQPGTRISDHTMLGCGIALGSPYHYLGAVTQDPDSCARWPAVLEQAVTKEDPDVVLILVGRWETMDRVHRGRWTHIGDPSYDDYLCGELDRAVGIATAHGATVVLATEPYNLRAERPDGGLWPEDEPARVDKWNTLLRQVAAGHPDTVRVVDFGARLCPAGRYTATVDGVSVRSDGVHLTQEGVHWLAPWLLSQLVAAAQ
jgi:peptidoglycan/LPS O-acetylase OafA/YrhL